jgi:mRNA interferase MazF
VTRWASLPESEGSGPGSRRPVLVLQSDRFNRSNIRTVIVVALTSYLRIAEAPGNVLLASERTGLPRDSMANVSQVLTVDRAFLTDKIGTLPQTPLRKVEEGLRLVLSL